MKKYSAIFLILMACTSCGIISKQYYYVPSVTHQTIKGRYKHSDRKMIYSRFRLSNRAGDSIGAVTTSNGTGHRLLMGPVLPIIPVGGFFRKSDSRFVMELTVTSSEAEITPLTIDSNGDKRVSDPLQNSQCYLLVNDTLKFPLRVDAFFIGQPTSHSYWMTADIPFKSIRTLKLFTGNTLLDSTLKNVTFTRMSRIKFDLVGPGY